MQLKHQDIEEATIKIRYGDKSFETIKQEDLAERIRTITEEIAPGKKICTDKDLCGGYFQARAGLNCC